jgi:hypothetical protein
MHGVYKSVKSEKSKVKSCKTGNRQSRLGGTSWAMGDRGKKQNEMGGKDQYLLRTLNSSTLRSSNSTATEDGELRTGVTP